MNLSERIRVHVVVGNRQLSEFERIRVHVVVGNRQMSEFVMGHSKLYALFFF